MATTTAILYCVLSMFMGSTCMSAMGFGCGITYLFVYQIGSWSGLEECCGLPGLKYQVLLSILGLFAISPLLLFKTGLRHNVCWPIYVVLMPISMVTGPLGQILQGYTPVPILRIIVGVATLFVAFWQLFSIYHTTKEAQKVADTVFTNAITVEEVVTEKSGEGNCSASNMEQTSSQQQTSDDKTTVKDQNDAEKGAATEKNTREKVRLCCVVLKEELCPLRGEMVCMFLAGLTGGILGGLVGAGGPPVILFFFLFNYPREVVRANGSAMAVCNSLVLLVTYLTTPPPAEHDTLTWFVLDDVWLYVGVIVAGWVGCPVGIFLHGFLDKWGYRAGLCALLILNGISMIATAGVALSNK